MLDDGIINRCVVFRPSSASLFKYFLGEIREVNSFDWLRLPEVVDIILSWLGLKDWK